ncbi:serine/threonine-protein kinase VRK1 [Aplysia californica]|uniref:Serine/threonine-protein kinase VRK1 n=1 Tax=Aplysia californica TaxID=6500 RepID=A0ABM0ZWV2_APLCA|nr:serine/threonine-protein kinase VRK1 [Aplysia californica]
MAAVKRLRQMTSEIWSKHLLLILQGVAISSHNMPRAAASGAKKAAPKAHKLAEQFPKDSVLRDLFKKEWLLGDVIGRGGFGLIYLASEKNSHPVKGKGSNTDCVIKIEPKGNGPLFCEMQFYQRVAKLDLIQAFIQEHKLQYLPVPPFLGTGSHMYMSNEYRFLVMPRYGTDLQKLLDQAGGTFPAQVVFAVGLRILDALQYIHEKEYVHADVKAANILQGYHQGKILTNQVYLVDFGLAYRYTVGEVHKEYKEDPRKAHDGTIEFTSRDAHKGVAPSRRADMEILGYCLLQWLCGKLPWENKLTDPSYVAASKEKFMQNVPSSISTCFSGAANPNSVYSDTMAKFLDVVKKLKYEETPGYWRLKTILRDGLTKAGHKNEWTIDFSVQTKTTTKRKSTGGSPNALSPVKKAKAGGASAAARKKTTPKKRTPKTATPKKRTPKTATPKKRTPKTATPKKRTPKTATPKKRTPKTATPMTTESLETSPETSPEIMPSSKRNGAARLAAKASPVPRKKATPKRATPMTTKSPETSPKVTSSKRKGRAKFTAKASKKDSVAVKQAKGPVPDTPLTRSPWPLVPNEDGDSLRQSSSAKKDFPMPAPSVPAARSPAAKYV